MRWNPVSITVAGVTGVFGNASNKLYRPYGATLDYLNTLYIADRTNNRIQKYLMGSSYGVTVAGQPDGSTGITSDYLKYPGGLTVNSDGDIYIADTVNNRTQLWKNGASTGTTVAGNSAGK